MSESVDEASEMYEENQDQMEEEYDDQVEDDDDDIEDEEIVSGTIATNSNLSHAPQSAARIDETLPAQQKDQRETDSEVRRDWCSLTVKKLINFP